MDINNNNIGDAVSASYYSETADKLFSRGRLKPLRTGIKMFDNEIAHGIRPGNVIEITGPTASAKTEILLNVVASFILPKTDFNGEETSVVFYDNDYHFDMFRMIQLLEQRISQKVKYNKTQLEMVIKDSLSRLFLIRSKDSFEFLMSLKSLPALLSSNTEIKTIIIDSISAYFWSDKSEEDVGRTRQRRYLKQLSSIINEFNVLVFATKQILFPKENTVTSPPHSILGYTDPEGGRDYMTNLWSDMVHYRFHVRRLEEKEFGTPQKKASKVVEFRSSLVFPQVANVNNYIFSVRKEGVVFR